MDHPPAITCLAALFTGNLGWQMTVLLDNLNHRLCETLNLGQFATMFCATVDVGYAAIEFAAAGAPSGVLVKRGEGTASLLDGSGLPLGLLPSATYPSRHASLPPGSSLFLVSDGLLEMRGHDGAMLGSAGVSAAACRAVPEPGAGRIVAALVEDLIRRAAAPPQDDLTVICLSR